MNMRTHSQAHDILVNTTTQYSGWSEKNEATSSVLRTLEPIEPIIKINGTLLQRLACNTTVNSIFTNFITRSGATRQKTTAVFFHIKIKLSFLAPTY